MKKKAVVLLCTLLLMLTAVGCGSGSNAGDANSAANSGGADQEKKQTVEVTMAYWANASEQKNFEYMIDGLEKEHPNIKVKMQMYPTSDEFWKAVPAAIAAGVGPDIIAMSDEGNYEYIKKGVLAPLDELIDKVGFEKDRITASLYKGWTDDNKLFGIPYDSSTSMLAVNKKMFEASGITKQPETMDEVVELAKAMSKDGVKGIIGSIDPFHITQYVHAFGGDWGFGKTINSKENIAGVQFFVDLFLKHQVAIAPIEVGAPWDGEVFSQEKGAMSTAGPWYVGHLKEANPDMEMIALPMPKGTVEAQSAYSHGLSILAGSKNKEEAMQVIKYALRDDAQINAIEAVGYSPAVSALLPKYLEKNPELKPVFDNMEKVGMPFAYPEQTKAFHADLLKGVEEIIFKKDGLTVEQLLNDLQSKYGQN
ncbi:MAG: extracellular solute-binding protein [Paenibacillus sp.]|uniref:Carbohydrate ABC transporter substrate-binding protein, CUT1 family n=1 Tax=Paenibacillus aquistagni TaxID=1852522 RepID=A0A1X7LV34_9BACL|nr:extracellular solute-binding protein [Paenibacillus aquistagni]MBR2568122.1 extracellular solute-binding protein [Paenibacillus sp.]SMG57550.1 carbohydrate ABC transporter substrate-binding protein, CUT1 family [Paenibacillus aquistagni]